MEDRKVSANKTELLLGRQEDILGDSLLGDTSKVKKRIGHMDCDVN